MIAVWYWLSDSLRRINYLPLLVVFLLWLAACDLLGANGTVNNTPVPATATADANVVPVLSGTPDASVPITSTENNLTVTIWLPPEIMNRTEAGYAVLEQQWLAFRSARPDVTLTIEQKAVQGQGGILNYLRAGRNVAPAALPDLIALPTNQLATAANEELIYPIGDWLDSQVVDNLYPAAKRLGQVDDELIGYPFAVMNLPHLVYHSELSTARLPSTWAEMVTNVEGKFVFPGAGEAGVTLVLQFYLASGGTLVNEAGQPALQAEPLVNALSQFSLAQSNEFLVLADNTIMTGDDAWQLFQGDSSLLALTMAEQFLTLRSAEFEPIYAPVPGLEAPLVPLLDGWAWVLSTTDPTRRTLALELLASLIANDSLGEWSYASNILPSHQEAFDSWPAGDGYSQFVQAELERADAFPIGVNSDMLLVFQNALLNVISLGMSPQAAAEQAMTGLQP